MDYTLSCLVSIKNRLNQLETNYHYNDDTSDYIGQAQMLLDTLLNILYDRQILGSMMSDDDSYISTDSESYSDSDSDN